MRKADASGARYALIIGDEEAQARMVSVKPLRGGPEQAQARVSPQAACEIIKSG
jgi:histidyl-tRNA synthetase